MSINKPTLITKLQAAINDYVFGSTSVENVLSQSLSSWLLGEINIVTVNNVDELPTLELYDSTDAILCFLLNLGIFAISSNKKWLTLDGRVLRDDTGNFYSINYAWGCNIRGQLGNNSTIDRSSPVSVVSGFTDWCQVSAGQCHSVGIRFNGTAWAWGDGTYGKLGNNSTIIRSSPVLVAGGFTDWCQIAAGECFHTLAVRKNGTAWAWGNNGQGRLGDNNSVVINRSSPVSVAGGFTDWCQVSAGNLHSLGLRANGTAWAWGSGEFGELGTDTSGFGSSRSSPVSVVGGFTDWCQISAGGAQSLGLRSNGTAWAWGFNSNGRLGDNSTINRSSPVSVVGGFTDWCQVSGGLSHNLGVRTNGTAWGWGFNGQGQLGDNCTIQRSSPVSIVGGFADWGQVSAEGGHSLGITRR